MFRKISVEKWKETYIAYGGRLLWGAMEFLLEEIEKREKIICDVERRKRFMAIREYSNLIYIAGVLFLTHSAEFEKEFEQFKLHMGHVISHFEEHYKKYSQEDIKALTKCITLGSEIINSFIPKSKKEEMKEDYLVHQKKK